MKRYLNIIFTFVLVLGTTGAWSSDVGGSDLKTFQAGDPLKASEMNQNFSVMSNVVNSKQDRVTGVCDPGQAVKQINADGTVVCETMAGGGDITAVLPSIGLIGGGVSGDVTLGVDTAYLQRRVSGTCAIGSAIKGVNPDGTVLCETIPQGDITAVTSGVGLLGGGLSGAVSLSVNSALVQNRVTGTCTGDNAIKSIGQDGLVTCQATGSGDITAVNTGVGSGLTGGAPSGDVNLAVDTGYIQRRVNEVCAVGSWVRTIEEDGTVSCEALSSSPLVAQMQAAIATLENTVKTLQSQLSALQNSNIMDLDPYVSVTVLGGRPNATFSGINLQLVNGSGNTGSVNGLGNLIIGYDTARDDNQYFCADGAFSTLVSCIANGKEWAISHKSGSHNLVIGDQNNYSQYGSLVVGYRNTSNRNSASISAGAYNTASGSYSSISGGTANTASNSYSVVSGGSGNNASGYASSVSGGAVNTAGNLNSSISGGIHNTASNTYSSVSGGEQNNANASFSSISGGYGNVTNGMYSSVSGGQSRNATGLYDWVAGGLFQDQ